MYDILIRAISILCWLGGCGEVQHPAPPASKGQSTTATAVGAAPSTPSTGTVPSASPGTESPASPERIRRSPIAGSWYPGQAGPLSAMLDGFLSRVSRRVSGYPMAFVVPHAGYRFSGPVAAHAYRQLRDRTFGRVFVLGPAHRVRLRGFSVPGFTHYQTPLGRVPVDLAAVQRLVEHPLVTRGDGPHLREHSIEMQLPFLQRVLDGSDWSLVPVLVGDADLDELKDLAALLKTLIGPGDLLVASSDFTHWGGNFDYWGPPGATFDRTAAPKRLNELMDQAWAHIRSMDGPALWEHKLETRDTICGVRPIVLLLETLPAGAKPYRLRSDTSGNMTGKWDSSVSYMAVQFSGLWPYNGAGGSHRLDDPEKAALLKLARGSLEAWVREGRRVSAEELGVTLTDRLRADSGVFVTLNKRGRLRGCIGTIPPIKPLYKAVLDNAVNAAAHDRRFQPVTAAELDGIEVEVSVLTPPKPVSDWRDIILARHGVLLGKGGRRAVYLPQVAPEQGWTLPETLDHLARKAGLGFSDWRTGATFEIFEAIVFHEPGH